MHFHYDMDVQACKKFFYIPKLGVIWRSQPSWMKRLPRAFCLKTEGQVT